MVPHRAAETMDPYRQKVYENGSSTPYRADVAFIDVSSCDVFPGISCAHHHIIPVDNIYAFRIGTLLWVLQRRDVECDWLAKQRVGDASQEGVRCGSGVSASDGRVHL